MRILDIDIEDIRNGKNWRVCDPDALGSEDFPLGQTEIEECTEFRVKDIIVYSAVYVTNDGLVRPFVLIKEAFDFEYGGDYCVYENGEWRQLGLVPSPNAVPGNEYIANPLDEDESFNAPDHDFRKWNREHFNQYAKVLG